MKTMTDERPNPAVTFAFFAALLTLLNICLGG